MRRTVVAKRQQVFPNGGSAQQSSSPSSPSSNSPPDSNQGVAAAAPQASSTANNRSTALVQTTSSPQPIFPTSDPRQQAPSTTSIPTTPTTTTPPAIASTSSSSVQTTSSATTSSASSSTTSSSTSSRSTTSSRTTSTTPLAAATSSSSSSIGTSVVVVSAVPSNSFASGTLPALASPSNTSSGDGGNSVGTGTVIGAVAGGLVGLVVLAGLLGVFLKSRWGKDDDEYQDNPFGNEKFSGIELDGGSDDGHHLANMPPILSRSGTLASSSQPLGHAHAGSWNSHDLSAAPSMPALEPGQVMAFGGGPGGPAINRSLTPNPPPPGGGAYPTSYGHMMPPPQIAALERAASARYAHAGGVASPAPFPFHPHHQHHPFPPQPMPTTVPTSLSDRAPQLRPLSLVGQDPFVPQTVPDAMNGSRERSGTPVDVNPQQTFFHHHHSASDTAGSGDPFSSTNDFNSLQQRHQKPGEGLTRQLTGSAPVRPRAEGGLAPDERAKRTLSVRNGGLADADDDAYGGI